MLDKSRSLTADLRRLCDKEEIRSAMYRYARGVDRRDYDLVRSAYHANASDDHGSYNGDVDGLIEWISRRHAVIDQSMHIIAQTHIDFLSDDVAIAESYLVCAQRYPIEAKETIRAWVGAQEISPDERLRVVMYARYNDRFERRDGEWKIALRRVVVEEVDAKVVEVRTGPPVSLEQVRGPEDTLYELLRG